MKRFLLFFIILETGNIVGSDDHEIFQLLRNLRRCFEEHNVHGPFKIDTKGTVLFRSKKQEREQGQSQLKRDLEKELAPCEKQTNDLLSITKPFQKENGIKYLLGPVLLFWYIQKKDTLLHGTGYVRTSYKIDMWQKAGVEDTNIKTKTCVFYSDQNSLGKTSKTEPKLKCSRIFVQNEFEEEEEFYDVGAFCTYAKKLQNLQQQYVQYEESYEKCYRKFGKFFGDPKGWGLLYDRKRGSSLLHRICFHFFPYKSRIRLAQECFFDCMEKTEIDPIKLKRNDTFA